MRVAPLVEQDSDFIDNRPVSDRPMAHWRLLLVCCLSLMTLVAEAQTLTEMVASPTARVSLLTCGPGTDVHTMYGHSAIRVADRSTGQDLVFNYGTFDFDAPGFLFKFVRGQLPYTLSVSGIDSFVRSYQYAGRSVVQNEIMLDSTQRAAFLQFLDVNYRPENREYAYDFFFDNCSSRIWDVIDHSVDQPIALPEDVPAYTYRDMIELYQQGSPWTDLGIDLIIGSPADHEAGVIGQMFLPDFLQRNLMKASVGGNALLGPSQAILPAQGDPMAPAFPWPLVLFGILLALEVYFVLAGKRGRALHIYDRVWFFLIGLIGIILAMMWLFTNHQATHRNFNLIWASPLYWLLAFFSLSAKAKRPLMVVLGLCGLVGLAGVLGFLPQSMSWAIGLIILITMTKLHRLFWCGEGE